MKVRKKKPEKVSLPVWEFLGFHKNDTHTSLQEVSINSTFFFVHFCTVLVINSLFTFPHLYFEYVSLARKKKTQNKVKGIFPDIILVLWKYCYREYFCT